MQGLDYFYTLQGFIKGVNGNSDSAEHDFGGDGNSDGCEPVATGIADGDLAYDCSVPNLNYGLLPTDVGYGALHAPVGRDAFAYHLDYYTHDYAAAAQATSTAAQNLDVLHQSGQAPADLYNGNISRM